MSQKTHFLLKYGSRKQAMDHINSIEPNAHMPWDQRVTLSKMHSLQKEDIDSLVNHPNADIASQAIRHPDVTPMTATKTVHDSLRPTALKLHASHEQLNDLAKSKNPSDREIVLHSKNSTRDHIKTVLKHSEPYDKKTNDGYYDSLGSAMIHHDVHAPIKSVDGNKPYVYLDHDMLKEHLLSGGKTFKKMSKDWRFHMPQISTSNATEILTSHPDHVNIALQSHANERIYSSVDGGHHLLLAHPKLTDETLRSFGVAAASSRNTDNHTAAITAAYHRNASPETKKAIAAAMSDSSPYKRQITRIAERA